MAGFQNKTNQKKNFFVIRSETGSHIITNQRVYQSYVNNWLAYGPLVRYMFYTFQQR